MKAHQINENGEIINTILVNSLDDFEGLVDAEIGGSIGDSIVDGKVISRPVKIPVEQTFAYQKDVYLEEVRVMREKVLTRLNGYGTNLLLKEPPSMSEDKLLCYSLIQGLLDITSISGVLLAKDMEQLKLAVKTEYDRLTNLASAELVKAFRQVEL